MQRRLGGLIRLGTLGKPGGLGSPVCIRFLAVAICVASTLLVTSHTYAETVRVAVAANFYPVMRELADQFELLKGQEGNESLQVELISGSSGKLASQIVQSAPFDLFLSADVARPLELEKRQAVVAGTRTTYALGQLAVLSRNSNNSESLDDSGSLGSLDNPLDRLQNLDFRRIAIANPRLAPYGEAARESMAGLAIELDREQLVYAENISQTYHFFQTGHVDLAFVAYAQVVEQSPENASYSLVPPEFYAPIQQQMVLLTNTKAAMDLYMYILSGQAQQLIGESGYIAITASDKNEARF